MNLRRRGEGVGEGETKFIASFPSFALLVLHRVLVAQEKPDLTLFDEDLRIVHSC